MLEFNEVTKSYDGRRVVDDVSFTCAPGTVTGFLGPNGAGKSTTMRMLCGLVAPDSGRARVLGSEFRDLPNPGREIGVLLDASAQHAGRKGREVLALAARALDVEASNANEMLDRVGLSDAGDKRVGQYSLGMRQRLGIASALIGDPRVLVLDEPANGLDPEGIRWMRSLLRDFADAGGTVLLSSHLLKEVDAVADRLVIISDGKIVADGTRQKLLDNTGSIVRAEDQERMTQALSEANLAFRVAGDGRLIVDAPPLEISRAAQAGGALLTHLDGQRDDALEDLFFDLVGDTPVAA